MNCYQIAEAVTNYLEGHTATVQIPEKKYIEAYNGDEEQGRSESVLQLNDGHVYLIAVTVEQLLDEYTAEELANNEGGTA